MPSAFFGKGALLQSNIRKEQEQRDRQLGILDTQNQFQMRQAKAKEINDLQSNALEQVKMAVAGLKGDKNSPEFQKSVQALIEPIYQTVSMASQNGVNANPDFFINQVRNVIESTPTLLEAQQNKAAEAGAVEGAKTEAKNASNQKTTLSSQEAESLGFEKGTIVQKSPDGKLDIILSPSEGKVRDQKINELADRIGDRDLASDIVDGRTRIEIVPSTGTARLINTVDNSVREIPIGGSEQENRPPLIGKTLYEQADIATGPVSAAADIYSRTIGNIPGAPLPKETLEARGAFMTAMGDLRRSFAVNPKFPVGEMDRIEEEVNIKPSVFDSGPALKIRLGQINRSLKNRLIQFERDAKDTSLPQGTRSAQASNASAIRNFLQTLGEPEDVSDAPEGVDPDLWKYMKPEEKKLWRK